MARGVATLKKRLESIQRQIVKTHQELVPQVEGLTAEETKYFLYLALTGNKEEACRLIGRSHMWAYRRAREKGDVWKEWEDNAKRYRPAFLLAAAQDAYTRAITQGVDKVLESQDTKAIVLLLRELTNILGLGRRQEAPRDISIRIEVPWAEKVPMPPIVEGQARELPDAEN